MQSSLFEPTIERNIRPFRGTQGKAVEEIRQAVKDGHKRIILQAPCGFGKTLVSAHLIAGALDKRRRPMFTCPAISLVDQTLKAFEAEGIRDIGIIQAQHERSDRLAKVQIASIQTLIKRALPDVDFLICDEVHLRWTKFGEILDGPWKDKIAIGLSATPWAKGMGLRWTKLVIPTTIPEMIIDGFLTSTDMYIPEQVAVRANIDTDKGEFTEASASKEMRQSRIVGNVVKTWKKLSTGEKTFMFCVNREHAKEQMGAFIDSGIQFGYIDANTSMPDRTLEFEKMKYGDIAGIASVGCLIAGVDEDVRNIIMAAPTNSEMRHVQAWGRGIRTVPGVEKVLVGLDHAGNNSEEGLGLFWEIFHDHLDTHKKSDKGSAYEGEPKPNKPKQCKVCQVLIPKGHAVCQKCGTPIPSQSDIEHADGELALYGSKKKAKAEKIFSIQEKQSFYSGLLWICRTKGKSDGAAWHRFNEKFGHSPAGYPKEPKPPSYEVEQYYRHCIIRYIKSKEKEAKKGAVTA